MTPIDSSTVASTSSSEDVALVDRIAHRDAEALARLYDRYSAIMMALAQRILRDSGEAEDVLQEAFVQVWKQAERYNPARSSVSTWLVLIIRSRAIDRLRRRQVGERTAVAAQREKTTVDTSNRGVQTVLVRERHKRVQEELARLPSEQRNVIELAFYRGLTQSEIAAQTSIPLGTVKTRTLLAMKKLRKALGPEIKELL